MKPLQKIFQWLFFVPEAEHSVIRIVTWWEKRRIPYNLIVGVTGLISLLLFFLSISKSGELKPGEDAIEPMALFMAPIFMNLGYTLGWIVEVTFRLFRRRQFRRISRELFQAGLFLSVAVVILPSAFWFLRFLWGTVMTSIH